MLKTLQGTRAVIYRFGDCSLDTAARRLRRNGQVEAVEPQVMRLLLLLLENRHRVVTRQELNETIWNGRLVTDAAVNSRLKAARAAVGDDGRTQSVIRTHQRHGYQFVAAVSVAAGSMDAPAPPPGDVRLIVEAGDDLDALDLSLPSRPSVAMIPLTITGDPGTHGLLADGLTHDIITQLSRVRWLFVAARGSTFKFRNGPYDEQAVGRALGVRYVVQGHAQFHDGRVELHVALCDASEGSELWAEHYRRRLDDIVAMQEDVAELIVGAVESEVDHAERERASLMHPERLDAWAAYHRACWHMYRFTPEDYDLAERFFQRSLELAPLSPRAHAGMSFVHWQRAFLEITSDPLGDAQRALEFAQESLSLDSREPHAHWAVGRARLLEHDLDGAVEELERCVELNPSSAMGQYSLSYALMQRGDSARSNGSVARARRLSPYDAMTFAMYAVRAQNLLFQGEYETAARFAARAAQQPNAHYHVVAIAAVCSIMSGQSQAAAELMQRLRAQRPNYSAQDYLKAFNHRPRANVALVHQAFKRLGQARPGTTPS